MECRLRDARGYVEVNRRVTGGCQEGDKRMTRG